MNQAGAGPSTMVSHAYAMEDSPPPSLPTGVKRFASQRRVEVLVSPSGDEDLSAQSLSPNVSLSDHEYEVEERDYDRSTTPAQYLQVPEMVTPVPFIPRGIDENGVRGIMRASGVPGSGNGVRFFPKNKFRVITPNPSTLNTPKAAPPPSPNRNSFLSHLLSVSLPLRRSSTATPDNSTSAAGTGKADESWEQPGQEGEVSLIGSSGPSERSWKDGSNEDDEHDDESEAAQEDGRERPEERPEWRGEPQVHSSPLSLPASGEVSRDISATDLPPPFPAHPHATPNPGSTSTPPSTFRPRSPFAERDPDADAVENEVSLPSASGDWSLEIDEDESQLLAQTLPELAAAAGESFSMSEFAGLERQRLSEISVTSIDSSIRHASPSASPSSSRTTVHGALASPVAGAGAGQSWSSPASSSGGSGSSWSRHPTPVQRRPSALRNEVVWDSDSSTNRETSGEQSSLGRSTSGGGGAGLDRSSSTLDGSVRVVRSPTTASPSTTPTTGTERIVRSTTPVSPSPATVSTRSPATVRRVRASPPIQPGSPIPVPPSVGWASPTPSNTTDVSGRETKPFRSIFADMSAEQAQLSWPLAPPSHTAPAGSSTTTLRTQDQRLDQDAEDEASVRSVIFSDSPLNLRMPGGLRDSPYRIPAPGARPNSTLVTPRERGSFQSTGTPSTAGVRDRSRYYDAPSTPDSTSPQSSPPAALRSSLVLSASISSSVTPLTPSAQSDPVSQASNGLVQQIIQPTQAVFAAHNAHVQALAEEMDIYRELVGRLQREVAERDERVAVLSLRVVEGETWRAKAEQTMETAQSNQGRRKSASLSPAGGTARRASNSPTPSLADSPTPSTGPRRLPQQRERSHDADADRTTLHQAENRDLEIRLAKAFDEIEGLGRQVRQVQEEKDAMVEQVRAERAELNQAEERARDEVVAMQRELQRVHAMEAEVETLRRERDVLQRTIREEEEKAMEGQMREKEMQRVLARDRTELLELRSQLERATSTGRGSEDVRSELEHVRQQLEREQARRMNAEKREAEGLERRANLQAEIKELKQTIKLLQLRPASSSSPTSGTSAHTGELESQLKALRSESASKDLEIAALQRRKAELKEDREMLNIALDSKQQELELLKRKFSVRGIAGSTPLGPSQRGNISPSSAALVTPAALSKAAHSSKAAADGSSAVRRTSGRVSTDSAFVTPQLDQGGRVMRSRDIQLHPSTQAKSRVMRKAPGSKTLRTKAQEEMEVLGEENVAPLAAEEGWGAVVGRRGSLRGARVLA